MLATQEQAWKHAPRRVGENACFMSDLLQRVAKSQDSEAFAALYQTYAPRLKSYMMRQGADSGVAEELAQEALLVVWRKAALYTSSKGSASTWIFTIARNLRIDRLRKERVWQALPDEHEDEEDSGVAPDEAASLSERRARVRLSIKQLPDDQREVIALSFMEGLSHSEIAARLDLPLGTVKSRMRLAYQKMREFVEDLE